MQQQNLEAQAQGDVGLGLIQVYRRWAAAGRFATPAARRRASRGSAAAPPPPITPQQLPAPRPDLPPVNPPVGPMPAAVLDVHREIE